MKKSFATACYFSIIIALAICLSPLGLPSATSQKIQPAEVVTKHLDAIGAAETRASIKNRIAAGKAVITFSAPANAKFTGDVIMASEGIKNMLAIAFENPGNVGEKITFDGTKLNATTGRPGSRGYLGDFVLTHDNIVKHGLVGGVLSEGWPLYNLSDKKQELEYKGTKKVGGKTVHEVAYVPKGSSDLTIVLFFDLETFQHVRTEYTRVISAGLGRSTTLASGVQTSPADASGQQRQQRYKLVEEFEDFKKEGGLSLPHSYKIFMELDTRGGTQKVNWDMVLTDFAFNQPIQPQVFNNTKAN